MKLRLLVTEDCNRNCPKCCNKQYNLKDLPVCTDFRPYELIMLTGGEPTIHPSKLFQVIKQIRQQTDEHIILYTANVQKPFVLLSVLHIINGMTLTLHEPKDLEPFKVFNNHLNDFIEEYCKFYGALRLNVFEGIDISDIDVNLWDIKHMKWVKDCPVPENEVFMRI